MEKFTKYLMKNKELHKLVNMLDSKDDDKDGNKNDGNKNDDKSVIDLDWKGTILPQWNVYFNSLIQGCRDDSKLAGFRAEFCDTPQLLRYEYELE